MGAICCSNSLDRKDDSYYEPNYSRFQNSNSYKRQYQKASSPGKPTGDSDTFWELTEDLINKHETDIMFTKTGLINTFDQICNYEGFKPILNTLQVKVNVNDNGTPYCKTVPIFKSEYYFDPKFTISQVIHCLHRLESRQRWDTNISYSTLLNKQNRLSIIYIQNKAVGIGGSKRDFYEKKIHFTAQSRNSQHPKHYYYFSSIDNEDYPPLNDVIRTNIVLGFHKFEVIPDTSQVKATMLLQIDLKLNKVTQAVYRGALLSTSRKFYNDLQKFMSQNPDLELTQYDDMNLETEAAESAGRIHMRLVEE